MPKTEYDIDGKAFHIEKTPTGWRGWFRDSELEIYEGELKRNVLITAGYKPLQPSGIVISSDSIYSQCEFRPPRTMEVAYQELLKRLSSGKKPAFRKDKSLHKFVIFARDDCVCFYCEQFIEKSTNIHLDHLVPRSKGGTDSASNIVTSCHKCNLKKSNSILHDLKDRLNELHSRNYIRGSLVKWITASCLRGFPVLCQRQCWGESSPSLRDDTWVIPYLRILAFHAGLAA